MSDQALAVVERLWDVVRLIATTEMGGALIEQDGAAVWTIRNGKLAATEFYVGADDALRAAGLDPDRLEAD